ncbi:MAG: hypothetical protein AAF532_01515 [Planctomycetota bacterium]
MPDWWPYAVYGFAAFLAVRTFLRLTKVHERSVRKKLRRERMARLAAGQPADPAADATSEAA